MNDDFPFFGLGFVDWLALVVFEGWNLEHFGILWA